MRNPNVPESLEGWWILHRMFGFDRRHFLQLEEEDRDAIALDARDLLHNLKKSADGDVAIAQLAGHKADLMLTHYAKSYDGLLEAQASVDELELFEYLDPRYSYVSVLELGLYDATDKIHTALRERGLKPNSPDWIAEFNKALAEQAAHPRNADRLWARIPDRRYVCFYPMDKRRGETANWYMLPYTERARLMVEHGKIGRTFHEAVTQVISGSIGYDDFEWGVDLYADDPIVFKKLIYEMRFDEASARYAEFGPFFTGAQFPVGSLATFLGTAE